MLSDGVPPNSTSLGHFVFFFSSNGNEAATHTMYSATLLLFPSFVFFKGLFNKLGRELTWGQLREVIIRTQTQELD